MSYENIPKTADETAVLTSPRDFFVEVAKGNIPGHSLAGIVQKNTVLTDAAFEDTWLVGGIKIQAIANETLEILSSDANDTSAGTGAGSVTFFYLDDTFTRRIKTVALNGTTPVALVTDYFRTDPLFVGTTAVVVDSGSNETNVGTITIRRTSDAVVRASIRADEGASADGHLTVPAGFTVFIRQFFHFFEKDQSGAIRGRLKVFGTNTQVSTGNLPLYQSGFVADVKALVPITEKSDFVFQAISSNPGPVEVNSILEVLIVDNSI